MSILVRNNATGCIGWLEALEAGFAAVSMPASSAPADLLPWLRATWENDLNAADSWHPLNYYAGDPESATLELPVVGRIATDNGTKFVQKTDGSFDPNQTTTTLTANFARGADIVASRAVVVTRATLSLSANLDANGVAGNVDVGGITYTITGNNSQSLTIRFVYAEGGNDLAAVEETIITVESGADGARAPQWASATGSAWSDTVATGAIYAHPSVASAKPNTDTSDLIVGDKCTISGGAEAFSGELLVKFESDFSDTAGKNTVSFFNTPTIDTAWPKYGVGSGKFTGGFVKYRGGLFYGAKIAFDGWIKGSAWVNYPLFSTRLAGASGSGFILYRLSSTVIRLRALNEAIVRDNDVGSAMFSDWHISLRFLGNFGALFVNGHRVDLFSAAGGLTPPSRVDNDLAVGGDENYGSSGYQFDEFVVHSNFETLDDFTPSETSATSTLFKEVGEWSGSAWVDKTNIYAQDGASGASAVQNYIDATQWVIYKDAPDAATSAAHTNITISGLTQTGSNAATHLFLTITANGDTESGTATQSPVTTAIANGAGKTLYTAKMYSNAAKATLLDTQVFPVVFKGAAGAGGSNALYTVLTNETHAIPTDSGGNNAVYAGSGTDIYIYEGNTELVYDGVGTSAGKYNVTAAGADITPGAKSLVSSHVRFADSSALTASQASIAFTISGKRADGTAFTLTRVQSIAKVPAGAGGAAAKAFYVSQTGALFRFTAVGDADPAGQTVTLTANKRNITGAVSWAIRLYDAAGAAITPNPADGSGDAYILTLATFGAAHFATVTASVTDGTTYTAPAQVYKMVGGSKGEAGQRGSIHFYDNTLSSAAWSESKANAKVTAVTGSALRVNGDLMTQTYGSPVIFVITKVWSGNDPGGAWIGLGQVIDGNLLVTGTVTAAALAADSITADKIAADSITVDKLTANTLTLSSGVFGSDFKEQHIKTAKISKNYDAVTQGGANQSFELKEVDDFITPSAVTDTYLAAAISASITGGYQIKITLSLQMTSSDASPGIIEVKFYGNNGITDTELKKIEHTMSGRKVVSGVNNDTNTFYFVTPHNAYSSYKIKIRGVGGGDNYYNTGADLFVDALAFYEILKL